MYDRNPHVYVPDIFDAQGGGLSRRPPKRISIAPGVRRHSLASRPFPTQWRLDDGRNLDKSIRARAGNKGQAYTVVNLARGC